VMAGSSEDLYPVRAPATSFILGSAQPEDRSRAPSSASRSHRLCRLSTAPTAQLTFSDSARALTEFLFCSFIPLQREIKKSILRARQSLEVRGPPDELGATTRAGG